MKRIFLLTFTISVLLILNTNLTFATAEQKGDYVKQTGGIENDSMTFISATPDTSEEMATGMRSNGLIYVVVGVIIIILGGVTVYMVSIDRKISRMEKQIQK